MAADSRRVSRLHPAHQIVIRPDSERRLVFLITLWRRSASGAGGALTRGSLPLYRGRSVCGTVCRNQHVRSSDGVIQTLWHPQMEPRGDPKQSEDQVLDVTTAPCYFSDVGLLSLFPWTGVSFHKLSPRLLSWNVFKLTSSPVFHSYLPFWLFLYFSH